MPAKSLTIPEPPSLVRALRQRASQHPQSRAFLFLRDGEEETQVLTYGELDQRARAVAVWLEKEVGRGQRALLLYPPGTDFACALFGCFYAGVIAVPAPLPDPARLKRTLPRVRSILRDADPVAVLATAGSESVRDAVDAAAPGTLRWLHSEEVDFELAGAWQEVETESDDLAYIQFTSGSTSSPKGVMASHGNLLHNCRAVQSAKGYDADSVAVIWVPNFHDDGLVHGTALPVYAGYPCVLMPALSVVQKPERWLRAISHYRATHSGGPNFIYSLTARKARAEACGDLDLSCWRMAYNAGEPVRHDTLVTFHRTFTRYGFRWDAFYPAYGMAETTLTISTKKHGVEPTLCNVETAALERGKAVESFGEGAGVRTLVSSGQPIRDTTLRIVDPESQQRCQEGAVGEIWVSNPSVARGYWRRPETTDETFGATLEGDENRFLRTGDLGFVTAGEVFVTGRWKDLIIIRGRNIYPQDVERTVETSHPLMRLGCSTAFGAELEGEERLVVAAEVDRRYRGGDEQLTEVVTALRQAVTEGHELATHAVLLLAPGSIPKTSSGKLRRRACRQAFLDRTLKAVGEWSQSRPEVTARAPEAAAHPVAPPDPPAIAHAHGRQQLDAYLRKLVAQVLRLPESAVASDRSLHRYGIDSLKDVELAQRVQADLGLHVGATTFLRGQSLDELADHFAQRLKIGTRPPREHDARLRVSRIPREDPRFRTGVPLSFAQQRLWFLDRLIPRHYFYNVPFSLRFTGKADVATLTVALSELVRRHEILRTTFAEGEGDSVQVIHPPTEVEPRLLPRVDLAALGSGAQAEARRLADEETKRPFDLEAGPLLRCVLFSLGPAEHLLYLNLHHIVTDGWSLGVLYRDLTALIGALRAGRPSPLPELPFQYADFALWQHEQLTGETLAEHLTYWRRQLANPTVLELPTDRPRPAVQSFRSRSFEVRLPADLADSLRRLGRRQEATLNMTLLAAFFALLYRVTGQEKILLGSPSANRNIPDSEGLIGFFVNSLTMVGDLSAGPAGRELDYRQLLDRVRQMALDAYAHQDLPFERLVGELGLERDLSRNPLFQVMFALQNLPLESSRLDGLTIEPLIAGFQPTHCDLEAHLWESPEGLDGFCAYDHDLFDATTIERLMRRFEVLLGGIVADPGRALAELPATTAAERHQLLAEWNDSQVCHGPESLVHELMATQAKRTPGAVAVRFRDRELTWEELDQRANRLAHHLRALGVGPDVLVGLCTERSLEMMVGLFGILKAGGAYLPLDPDYPRERLTFMLADAGGPAGAPVLLTQAHLADRISDHAGPIVRLDGDWPAISRRPATAPVSGARPDNLVYAIYTSGSTGRPKGAMNSHRGVVNRLRWMQQTYHLDAGDRVLQKTPISFDVSVWELFWPLMTGARQVIAEPGGHRDPGYLVRTVIAERVTTLHFVPSMLGPFLDEPGVSNCRSLRRVIVSGEALTRELEERFFARSGAGLHNLYGPTEAAVDVTWWACAPGSTSPASVPIGRPVDNTRIHVLGAARPRPTSSPGELAIGGVQLARGYLRRPGLTAERFVPDPLSPRPGQRLYLTGDLVRHLADGNLEFLGRIDHQVKIRGFRIELGEIEAALSEHPAVRDAAVVARQDSASSRLVAYLTLERQSIAGEPDDLVPALRTALRRRLPEYMVPAAFVVLDAFPVTANGKLDRKALPAPRQSRSRAAAGSAAAPAGHLEKTIAGFWKEALATERIGVLENFFDLGGHSLGLMAVRRRLQEALDRDIAMTELFRYPTIRSLAEHLSPRQRSQTPAPAVGTAQAAHEIAIVAMAGRFPGADSVEELWRNLCAGTESITFFRDHELDPAIPAELREDPRYVKAGGVVGEIELFDADFFGFTPREAELLDPQHRLFLECAWEALERSGHDSRRYPGRIGVFAGASRSTYLSANLSTHAKLVRAAGFDVEIANDKDFLPTRVSYKLDLTGPSVAVQTACSTSLVAAHQACESLVTGRCDMALAGGVTLRVPQRAGHLYRPGMITSPDGHTRTFDAKARGTVGGNGAGVVVLKRLSDALADGNKVHAVIRGFGLNNDGSVKVGYTAPGVAGQAAAISEALARAGVDPETVGYVEAHGTGTELGDPVEIAALSQAFGAAGAGEKYCALGSVKTNLGHLDTAAGVTGLIKTALVLEHGMIPPSLHFEQPNPEIDFDSGPFFVNTRLRDWPGNGRPRRAGVSSFGIGGTNAHATLEEAPEPEPPAAGGAWHLVLLSARTTTALEAATARLAAHLRAHPEQELADVAYTLAMGRRELEHRRLVVGRDGQQVAAALESGDGVLTGDATESPSEAPVELSPQALDREPEALTRLGELWLRGVPVDWQTLYGAERRHRLILPTYPFERRRYWIEPAGVAPGAPEARAPEEPAPGHQRPALASPYAAPGSDRERLLTEIWQEVFGIAEIGVDDDFFELGGHSLLATQVLSRVQETLGVELSLAQLFQAGTVAGMAKLVKGRTLDARPRIPALARQPGQSLPVSFAQQRLWFLDRLTPGNTFYNMPAAFRLRGPLAVAALERTLNEIVRRHETLRTTFAEVDGEPVQVIHEPVPSRLSLVDLTVLAPEVRAVVSRQLADDAVARPFELAAGPLFRAVLLQTQAGPETEHILLLTQHHIVSDAWSVRVLQRELAALYQAFAGGHGSPLPELAIQYADFAVWQRQWLRGDVLEAQLEYWRQQLGGDPPSLPLPTDRPRPAVQRFRGGLWPVKISAAVAESLRSRSREREATLAMTLLAGYYVLLHRLTGQEKILVGSPIAGRGAREVEELIGFFVNNLTLAGDLSGNPEIGQLLERVRSMALAAYSHQDLPFEKVVEQMRVKRDLSRNPIFQVVFAFQNAPATLELDGLELRPMVTGFQATRFDVELHLWQEADGLAGFCTFDQDLFDATTIGRLVVHYQTLLAELAAAPGDTRLSELPWLGAAQRHQLLAEWNDTATAGDDCLVVDRFERQAAARPDAVALVFRDPEAPDLTWSYGELDRRSSSLAATLRRSGVAPEVPVGVMTGRRPEMVLAFLGILKAGGVYMPLDPSYPAERLGFMVADARLPWILVPPRADRRHAPELENQLAELGAQLLRLDGGRIADDDGDRIGTGDDDRAPIAASSLAYLIYTSGSTGRPKGVAVSHAGLANLGRAQVALLGLDPRQRVLQFSSASFDASISELVMTLTSGACLHMSSRDALMPGPPLAGLLEAAGITTATLTPSTLAVMDRRQLPHLATLVVAGEACPPELARRWSHPGHVFSAPLARRLSAPPARRLSAPPARRRLVNGYGPTESTVCTTMALYRGGGMPIGRPLANLSAHVIDAGLRPLPAGAQGELLAGGAGVARGYHGRPALTAERFVPDPNGRLPGGRLYRTGDLARFLADGSLDYLGRLDTQVKIRGFRIELGEIETLLAEQPTVREAVVTAPDAAEQGMLVAYVTPAGEAQPAAPELREALRLELPEYMVPAAFVILETLPLLPSGKVDRQALPAPEESKPRGRTAPRNPTEELLAEIWREVLGRQQVGVEDDFFEVGGHSLLATRVISRIRERLGVEVAIRELFKAPTVASLARRVEAAQPSAPPPIVRRSGDLEPVLSFAQERLWFFDQLEPGNIFYNIPAALRLRGRLHRDALRRAFEAVIRRHEVLRASFAAREGRPVQVIAAPASWVLPLVDLAAVAGAEEVSGLLSRAARRPFDLERGPLFRTTLFRLAEREHILLFEMHHIVSDGWSIGILMRELEAFYRAARGAEEARRLPEPAISYADFAAWQRQWLRGPVLQRQLVYWQTRLAEVPPLELASDRRRPSLQSFRGAVRAFHLPAELSTGVRAVSRRRGTTLFMTLLAAFDVLLARYSGQSDVAVGTPIANRNHSETEELIGFFVNTLVLRAEVASDLRFRQLLARVQEEALGAYAHQDLPFERLVEALAPERDLSRTPLFQVMFAWQNAPLELPRLPELEIEPILVETRVSAFDLTLSMSEEDELSGGTPERLSGFLEYSTDLFDATTVTRLLRHFEVLLAAIVADPDAPIYELPMASSAERHQLLREWNDGDVRRPPAPVHELFAARVERVPDAIAVAAESGQLTYAGLAHRAGRLAGVLRSRGVSADVRVGVGLERSPELVVAFLAILEAGGVYVPLDPAHPEDRLAFLLADARLDLVLTHTRFAPRFAPRGAAVICLDEAWPESGQQQPVRISESDLAYVIYTSGSTGRPKGVMVEHRSVARLWAARSHSACWPRDGKLRFTLSAAPIFDASVDQLLALLGGHTLDVVPESVQRDAVAYGKYLADHRIDVLDLTPRELQLLLDARPAGAADGPGTVLVGGEAMPEALWQRLARMPSTRVSNLYGPTEGTVDATAALVTAEAPRPHIGRPLAHVRAYVLDPRGLPLALGIAGELAIAGYGVARGYQGRPGLTAERFVPEPGAPIPGARIYLTGDRARHLAGGEIEFLGRLDHQVKLRGYRIEPGEIEAVLEEHPAVAAACVVARRERLVAWVVPRPAENGRDAFPGSEALREHLGDKLPEYMIPALFAELEAMPMTASGKVDRGTLLRRPLPGSSVAYQQPRTEIERRIAEVWKQVLGLDDVGVHDNFFEVGGHSLNVVQVREKLDPELTIVEMFQYPTIHTLAGRLQGGAEAPAPAVERRAATNAGSEIAVIAVTGRFPGAGNADELWCNLRDGVESITFFSDLELAAAGAEPDLLARPEYVGAQGVVDDVDLFDAGYFDFNPREAELMDPQHRIFLECVVEALEQAGHGADSDVGIWAGASENAYFLEALSPDPEEPLAGMNVSLGVGRDFLATRASYKLDLKGPSLTVQTACSTSLVAVHLACRGLIAGDCDLAVAGGVSVAVPRPRGYLYQEGGILSPDGHCRAFDAAASGCVGGEGVGVVVLRRLADAVAGGDPILAVIKGSAINNDGAVKVGYTAPSVAGQAAVIRAAWKAAGVEPETASYVEAHGTGTPLGDPIEIAALNQVFGTGEDGGIAVGSIKTNVGHLDTAAGVAGLIKTVLALEHGQLPPSLNFREPNPRIDFGACRVQRELGEWPSGAVPRRAGVSSFGIGGTNAHVVLEQAPARPVAAGPSRAWQLLTFSARTPAALEAVTTGLARHLRRHPELPLADVAYTLAVGRRHLEQRRMVVGRDLAEVTAALEGGKLLTQAPATAAPPVVFLFPGQGAQYVNMGLALHQHEPVFRRQLDRCAQLLLPDLDLLAILYPEVGATAETSQRLEQTAHAQPALFAVEYALARQWMAWGVEPRVMIGHSVGEYVAACLAGVFSLEDALALVALRGRLMQSRPAGSMLAVPMPEAELRPLLGGRELDLAAVNGTALCVVSGPSPAIAALFGDLGARGVECRRLHTSHAFHSAAMEPIMEPFRRQLEAVPRQPPRLPWISNLSGTRITAEEATSPDYWVRHLRQAVRFADGLAELGREGEQVFLEVGPGRTLGTLARRHPDIPAGRTILASLPHAARDDSDHAFLLHTLGRLWLAGVEVDQEAFHDAQDRRRVVLPTYPFERQRFWVESPEKASEPARKTGDDGGRPPRKELEDWFYVPSWQQRPLAARRLQRAPGRALVMITEEGLGTDLARRLEDLDWAVTTASPGTAFVRRGAADYQIDPRRAEHYSRLLRELAEDGGPLVEIFHLWGLADGLWEELLQRGFYSLLLLTQAIGERSLGDLTIRMVTGPISRVTADETLSPARAAVIGLTQNLAAEYPGLECLTVDVVPPVAGSPAEERLTDQLLAELAAGTSSGLVAYRGTMRWRPGWQPVPLNNGGESHPRLRPRGVYLITGGLGGIGLTLAEHLAQNVQARLILTGRSVPEEPMPEIEALARLGAEVMVRQADVSRHDEMSAVLDEARKRFGGLHGVIHAAGVPGGGLIQRQTVAEAAAVLTPKIRGTLVLDELLRDHQLDFFLLCSSLSSQLGAPGQADYCAANAFLDAYAQACAGDGLLSPSRRKGSSEVVKGREAGAQDSSPRGGRLTVSVNWDTWREAGMAVDAVARIRRRRPTATPTDGEAVDHPLLDVHATRDEEEHYLTRLDPSRHWVVDEHRLEGRAVMPGTGFLELIRAAFAHFQGMGTGIEIRDLILTVPLGVEDGETREVRTTLRRQTRGLEAIVASHDGTAWTEHARGRVLAASSQRPPRRDLEDLRAQCGDTAVSSSPNPQMPMRFGPRWRSLAMSLRVGAGRSLNHLELATDFAADLVAFELHPALLDGALAITAGEGLHLPFSYGRVVVHAALPREIYSFAHFPESGFDADLVSANLVILDAEGRILVEIEDYTLRRMDERRVDEPSPPEVAGELAAGITNREGAEVFRRILGAELSQVIVSTRDLEIQAEESRKLELAKVAEPVPGTSYQRPDLGTPYVAPQSELEKSIAGIWQEVLGIAQVGVEDDFLELGGHSLLATQVLSRLRKVLGLDLPLKSFFEASNVADLVRTVEGLESKADTDTPLVDIKEGML